ncbi:hypothetical protein LX12_000204 [Williamsia serinedens]|uniref:Uncharacterized protein n=1 Tax=Williamsia serinedens TaxID=391736 RepID=A0ABT1GXC5_9NOCA|nr:hypothetical protein [Williamsia serinedens]
MDREAVVFPPRDADPDRAVDRVADPELDVLEVERDAVDRLLREVPADAVPDRRVPVDRRPEAAFDCDAGAAERRAVDLGLMPLRINRIRHRSPVHLTGHTGGVSVS